MDTPTHRTASLVTLDAALAAISGVRAEAQNRNAELAAVVVDTGGNIVASMRMDGAQLDAMPLAIDKAYTAVACGMPTETWGPGSQPGGPDWGLTLSVGGRFVVFAGGLSLRSGGSLVGGLGVSGAAAEVDRVCASAGLQSAGFDEV